MTIDTKAIRALAERCIETAEHAMPAPWEARQISDDDADSFLVVDADGMHVATVGEDPASATWIVEAREREPLLARACLSLLDERERVAPEDGASDAELAAARSLCVSEDLSKWSMERLYGALYQLHAAMPRALDQIEYQRATIRQLQAELTEIRKRVPTVDIVSLVEKWRPIVEAVQCMSDFDTVHSMKVTSPDGATQYLFTYAQSLPDAALNAKEADRG